MSEADELTQGGTGALTDVEMIQREIDRIGDLPEKLKALGWDLPTGQYTLLAIFGRYRAALELARADAEIEALYELHPQTEKWYELEEQYSYALKAARANLIKLLRGEG